MSRHDPLTGAVANSVEVGWSVLDLIIAGESVWVASDGIRGGKLSWIPLTGTSLAETIELDWRPEAMAVGGSSLWVHDAGFGEVHRFDLASGSPQASIALGAEKYEGRGIAWGEGAIWVALPEDDLLLQIDPVSMRSLARIPVEGYPVATIVG